MRTSVSDLVGWCRTALVPHPLAEESTLYWAAEQRPDGQLLVEAMLAEHQLILGLVDDLEQATDPVTAAVTAQALRAVFETHVAKENHQVLPLLVRAPGRRGCPWPSCWPTWTRLLTQLEQRAPGDFAIEYLERGPDSWRLSMVLTDWVRSNA